eukprot:COSAG03_NODE_26521_length_258_cov_1.647799_1_plen_33_part_01
MEPLGSASGEEETVGQNDGLRVRTAIPPPPPPP